MRAQPFVEVQSSAVEPQFPFRLRHLLVAGLILGILCWIWPRAQATLKLHNRAAALADYALCMVGPTGVELVKTDPVAFAQLVRRRVIHAMPDETPLASCFSLAEKLEVDHASLKLHQIRAAELLEYHNDPRTPGRYSLRSFELPFDEMRRLAHAAWPFVRSGYVQLMQPSSHAKEAAHPVAPPRWDWGSGLPARHSLYRSTAAYGDTWVAALGSGANRTVLVSTNKGVDWSPGGRRLAGDLLDRCVVDDDGRGFTLSRLNDGERIVVSQGPGAPPQVAVLAGKNTRIAGISCDDSSLVAALVGPPGEDGLRQIELRTCPFRQPCRDVPLPEMAGAPLFYPADVAKVGGDIIVSRTVGGITRVSSSRDDGRTWTPWVVVFDGADAATHLAPHRLLTVGDSVLLYGSAEAHGKYPLLVSTDHGASFHAPQQAELSQSRQEPKVAAH